MLYTKSQLHSKSSNCPNVIISFGALLKKIASLVQIFKSFYMVGIRNKMQT